MPFDKLREDFDRFRAGDFEAWLKGGLEAYEHEGRGAWSFPGAEGEIAASGHMFLYQGLHLFYKTLPAQVRAEFRLGSADVLASLEPHQKNVSVFEHILSLAAVLPAPEILRVLPSQVGNGFFGKVRDEENNLYELTLLTAARLAAPRKDAVACLTALITSAHHFHYAYSGVALEALCQADDSGLVSHMRILRPSLRAMFEAYGICEQAKVDLAAALLDAIGLDRMVSAWPELKYFDRRDEHAAVDRWLIVALLHGPNARLVSEQTEDGGILVSARTNDTVWVRIPEVGTGFRDMMDLLRSEDLVGPGLVWDRRSVPAEDVHIGLAVSLGLEPKYFQIRDGG